MSTLQRISIADEDTARAGRFPAIRHAPGLAAGDLERLSPEDRRLLDWLLRKPVEYIASPVFHEPGAETTLFGGPLRLEGESARFSSFSWPESPNGIHSAFEETRLFLQFNYARMRQQQLLEQFHRQPVFPNRLRLLLAWTRQARMLRDRIIESTLPLVPAVCGRFRARHRDHDELISEGNLTLLRCVDKYDCSRGMRFSTYVFRSILVSCIRLELKNCRRRSRFPEDVNRDPAACECAGFDCDQAEAECLQEIRRILADNLAALDAGEQLVLRLRFMSGQGARRASSLTLKQVGIQMGVTKERVRQIQNRAIRKLRVTLEDSLARGLEPRVG